MLAKYLMFFLAIALGPLALFAQDQPRTEIELSATARRLTIAAPAATASSLDANQVQREYTETLRRDLDDIASIALLRDGLPISIAPESFGQWRDAGVELLVISTLTRKNRDDVLAEAIVYDVKSGRRVTSIAHNGNVRGFKRLAHLVSDSIEEYLTGAPGIANTRIIFCKEVSPKVKEIYQVDRDGSNLVKLTDHKTLTMSPTVSRDGRLAYLTYKPNPEIWGQKTPGGPHVKLYPQKDGEWVNVYSPSFSPDGSRIAFVQPDGRGNTDIMVLDVSTGRVRKLTNENGLNSEISWNPAGNQMAFMSGRDGNPSLYLMEDDGTNVRKLGIDGSYNASPAWSPDGSMIAFVSRFEDNFDLFVYRLGDPTPYQITTGFTNSENPAWSPDSRHLIFSTTRDGKNRLYITDLSGTRSERVLNNTGCQQPIWVRQR